jgi:hypothetical protein
MSKDAEPSSKCFAILTGFCALPGALRPQCDICRNALFSGISKVNCLETVPDAFSEYQL